jgi:hypothetical protein
MYVARNTRPQVTEVRIRYCDDGTNPANYEQCKLESQRVSYAIPLEVIYLTPLHKWNPYNILYKGKEGRE